MQIKRILKIAFALLAMRITSPVNDAFAKDKAVIKLTPIGKKLMTGYSATLAKIRKEIYAALPSIDPGMKRPFMRAFRAQAANKPYRDNNKQFTKAVARCQAVAAPVLDMADVFLSNDQYDAKLIKASVIAEATPRGLAAFAEKSKANELLIKTLLARPALMRQMQMAGGARHGNYGLTMRIYAAIEHASNRAHRGILQRLALATALSQKPYLTFHNEPAYDPVTRYLDYQKAYLNRELDPAFPTFTTWDCRFITDDPYDNHEIKWFRKMLRNYEPNLVFSRNYLGIVHTDVGYCHPHPGIVPGNNVAQAIAGGGECGIRAWVGRVAERAFGIPVWGVRQVGHAALAHWAPHGWVTPLGAGWNWNWWDRRSGLDFQLETQARRHDHKFIKVLRARWIGATLGEKPPNATVPGTGGFWYAIANCQERAIVASAGPAHPAFNKEVRVPHYALTAAEKIQRRTVPRSAVEISVDKKGVIHIPAAACTRPAKTVRGVLFTKSFLGGMQLHYYRFVHAGRFGKKGPPPLLYAFKVGRGGKYGLTAMVVTVKPAGHLAVFVNHAGKPLDMTVPWTDGMWRTTQPIAIALKRGMNVLQFDPSTKFFAVSIKEFLLTPIR